jgi:NAD(P)H-quinone oxidoreductase subunit 6
MAVAPQRNAGAPWRERVLAIFAGLLLIAAAPLLRHFAGVGIPVVLAGQFVGLTAILWGLNRFFFRRLPLSGFVLVLFSVAVFGVLFLLGYFAVEIVLPFVAEFASRFIGLVHLADLGFYLFAIMTMAGAAGCAFSRNIIYSAWSLLFAFMGVAGLYIFLGADCPAVAQVLIYVGGILVLILFAIMLTKKIGGDPHLTNAHLALPAGGVLALATVATLSYMAVMAPWKVVAEPQYLSSAQGLGIAFLTEYLLPFEVASIVLLAALIGSVVIARKEIKETTDSGL